MEPLLIGHIGILVPDLEDAIERWSAATGYEFSPIGRFRTETYADSSNPSPHPQDVRISISRQGPPRIELMESTGEGTHAPAEEGIHHFGISGIDDISARILELAEIGISVDGQTFLPDGGVHSFFTDKSALDGVRLEYLSTGASPLVADDGSALRTDPETGKKSLWLRESE